MKEVYETPLAIDDTILRILILKLDSLEKDMRELKFQPRILMQQPPQQRSQTDMSRPRSQGLMTPFYSSPSLPINQNIPTIQIVEEDKELEVPIAASPVFAYLEDELLASPRHDRDFNPDASFGNETIGLQSIHLLAGT